LTSQDWDLLLNIIGNIFTICASALAILIYFSNKGKISKAVDLLLNHSIYASLMDLRLIIERLNQLNYSSDEHREEVINILNEIDGHIIGDQELNKSDALIEFRTKIKGFINKPQTFSEAKKRNLLNELRGHIRTIDLTTKTKSNG